MNEGSPAEEVSSSFADDLSAMGMWIDLGDDTPADSERDLPRRKDVERMHSLSQTESSLSSRDPMLHQSDSSAPDFEDEEEYIEDEDEMYGRNLMHSDRQS